MAAELWWIIPVGIFSLCIFVGISLAILSTRLISISVRKIDVDLEKIMLKCLTEEECRWITKNSLTIRGSYKAGTVTVHVFALPDGETELGLTQYSHANALVFKTKLTDGYTLHTSNHVDDAATPPLTGNYLQVMAVDSLEELYEHHKEGLSHLAKAKGLHAIPIVPQDELLTEIETHTNKVLKETLLKPTAAIRLPYLLFTKHKRANRTIAQQLEERSAVL